MSDSHRKRTTRKRMTSWNRHSTAALVVVNLAALAMYVLWQIADSWAVERAEAGGFDTTMLLPHHMVAWVVVHVLVASVLALAALAWPRHPRRDRPRRETPAPAPDPARTSG